MNRDFRKAKLTVDGRTFRQSIPDRSISQSQRVSTKHTSGISAPSIGFPTPSSTRYVGICWPSPVTELKKCNFETIGEFDVGRWPCGLVGIWGAVATFLLRDTWRETQAKERAPRSIVGALRV